MWEIMKKKNIDKGVNDNTYIEKYMYKLDFLKKLESNDCLDSKKTNINIKIRDTADIIEYLNTKYQNNKIEILENTRQKINKIIKPISINEFTGKIDLTGDKKNVKPDPTTTLIIDSKTFFKNNNYKEIPSTLNKIDFKKVGFKQLIN